MPLPKNDDLIGRMISFETFEKEFILNHHRGMIEIKVTRLNGNGIIIDDYFNAKANSWPVKNIESASQGVGDEAPHMIGYTNRRLCE